MNAATRTAIKGFTWSLVAYVLPTVTILAMACSWLLYCFVLPIGIVDGLWVMDHVPKEAICDPWQTDPDTGIEHRRCYFEQPFHQFIILESRQKEPDGSFQPLRKETWAELKWTAIIAATFGGGLFCCGACFLWMRLLRRATKRPFEMCMKEFDMSSVKRLGPLRRSQLEPEIEYIYRRIWAVVAPFQAYPTWEQFEVVCCKNVNPESDIPYFAYVCA